MVEEHHELIIMDPAQLEKPTYQCEENEENILMEGDFAKLNFYSFIFPAAILCFLLFPLLLCLAYIESKRWRLYLTPSCVRYQHPTVYCCFDNNLDIPLEDIVGVRCDQRQLPNVVLLRVVSSKIEEFTGYFCKPPSYQSHYVYLPYVKNAEEFADAVKGALAERGR